MTIASLHWVPSNTSTGIDQKVQYKATADSTWITYTTVSNSTTSAMITGLYDNTVYDFRVVSDCNFGGPAPSVIATVIKFVCPNLILSSDADTISYSFAGPGASITAVSVNLLDSTGTSTVSTQSVSPIGSISGSFSGLDEGTDYKVEIVLTAGTRTHTCPAQDLSTIAPCADPSSITATLS